MLSTMLLFPVGKYPPPPQNPKLAIGTHRNDSVKPESGSRSGVGLTELGLSVERGSLLQEEGVAI